MAMLHVTLLWMGRAVLLGMISAVPWFYGGANWSAQFYLLQASWVLLAITLLSVSASPAHAKVVSAPALALAALMALGLIQTISLPASLAPYLNGCFVFDAEVENLVQSWLAQENSGANDPPRAAYVASSISIDATQTAATVASMASALICLVCATQLFATRSSIQVLAATIVGVASAHCLFGLVQSVNKWNWLAMPHRSYFSTFVSQNSAPQYYASAIGAAITLLAISMHAQRHKKENRYQIKYPSADILSRTRRRIEDVLVELSPQSVAAISALLLFGVGVIAAGSSGGIIANCCACLISLSIVLAKRSGLLIMFLGVMVVGSGITIFSSTLVPDTHLADRLEGFEEDVFHGGGGRLVVWSLAFQAMRLFGLLGSGMGTFHFGILPFHTVAPDAWFYHAESIPVEILFEMGLVGLIIAAVIVWLVVRIIFGELERKKHKNLLTIGTVYCVVAIGLHAFVDFSLILPGVYLPSIALLGAFLGESQRLSAQRHRERRSDSGIPSRSNPFSKSSQLIAGYGLIGVLVAITAGTGMADLAGYAASEQLAYHVRDARSDDPKSKNPQANSKKTFQEIADEAIAIAQLYPSHPDAMVQSARALQYAWQQRAIESWDWKGVPTDKQREFTNPRFVASVIRRPEQSPVDFKKLIDSDPTIAKNSLRIHESFVRASALSPLDWRAAVGVFHSDMSWLSPREQLAIAARIFLLAGKRKDFAADIGHLLVLENKGNQRLPGINILTSVFAAQPNVLFRTAPSIAFHLNANELASIFPTNLAVRATTCRILSTHPNWPKLRESLLVPVIEQIESIKSPEINESLEFAWVARESGNYELEARLLNAALARNATRVDIRFLLANARLKTGNVEAALAEVTSCLNQLPSNAEYLAFQTKVRAQLDGKRN